MHVLVFRARRARAAAPGRSCKVPVFAGGTAPTDNSLVAVPGAPIVVENNYGYTGPSRPAVGRPGPQHPHAPVPASRASPWTTPHGGCHRAWTQPPRPGPHQREQGVGGDRAALHLRAPGRRRGALHLRRARAPVRRTRGTSPRSTPAPAGASGRVLTGVGLGYNNNYAPITLGPDGTAYVGVLGGLLSVRDTR